MAERSRFNCGPDLVPCGDPSPPGRFCSGEGRSSAPPTAVARRTAPFPNSTLMVVDDTALDPVSFAMGRAVIGVFGGAGRGATSVVVNANSRDSGARMPPAPFEAFSTSTRLSTSRSRRLAARLGSNSTRLTRERRRDVSKRRSRKSLTRETKSRRETSDSAVGSEWIDADSLAAAARSCSRSLRK
jgi:hypothetical protein